jgi:hypothetical protein
MNPDYVMAANCDQIPTGEKWIEMMQTVSPDEALKLRQHAIMCLAQNVQDQQSRLSKFGQGFKWRFCSLAA